MTSTENSSSSSSPAKSCASCGSAILHPWWASLFSTTKDLRCEGCGSALCKACHGTCPLLTVPSDKETVIKNGTIQHFCKPCFHTKSTIDFAAPFVSIEGTSGITFVYVHGGGGSRQMYYGHAQEMKKRYQHGAILLDLPGHGAMVDTPLTLESSAQALDKALAEATYSRSDKLVYVGGSLGAYIGFSLLDKFQDKFSAAVLMDCGQNVGPGASLKARLGLVMLNFVAKRYSNADLMKLMLGVSKKSKADFMLVETCFGAGNFFEQGEAQVECLRTVAPADYVGKVSFPILFMNGSEDHRDSENLWLKLCQNKASDLKVYEGGDHFFCHDTRFLDDILTRMHDLATQKA
jgi:pimeloyl-ACP methyl ester carboxylesterase/DNA-directed RNA polymerase subunit RPC12/RpoP